MAPSRSAFTYAVVRVVPDIEREEFLNAGLILFDRERRTLLARTRLDPERLSGMRGDCDLEGIRAQLELVERIASGRIDVAPFTRMTQSERFHWLTAPRSTVIQTSPVHVGVCDDPGAALEELLDALVRLPGQAPRAARAGDR